MKKVLIVKGTSFLDSYDLCEALQDRGVDCTMRQWNEIADSRGTYELAVLFGLTYDRLTGHRYAKRVRGAIGPGTKLLIVTQWDRLLFEREQMKKRYDAEYFGRSDPILMLVATVLDMLNEAKTAP